MDSLTEGEGHKCQVGYPRQPFSKTTWLFLEWDHTTQYGEERYSLGNTVYADAKTPENEARANSVRGTTDENIPRPKLRFLGLVHSKSKSPTEPKDQ